MLFLYTLVCLISLTSAQFQEADVEERGAVPRNPREKVEGGIVYYKIEYSGAQGMNWKPFLKTIFELWQNFTCIQFKNLESSNVHVDVNSIYHIVIRLKGKEMKDCTIDKTSTAKGTHSVINLPDDCRTKSFMTKIGRILGLRPEHRRPDRNLYIDLAGNAKNPRTSTGKQYTISRETKLYGMPYDYESVLHASWNDTSGYPAISTKNANLDSKVGSEMIPSFYDFKTITYFYECNVPCNNHMPCFNGGYRSTPDCSVCRCYPGYGGDRCQIIETRQKIYPYQHRWSNRLVGKVTDCRAKILGDYVTDEISQQISNLVGSSNLNRRIAETAGLRIKEMLAGNVRHMPFKALGGYSAPLFVSSFKDYTIAMFNDNEAAAARALGGSGRIVDMLKNDLTRTLNNGLNSGRDSQIVAQTIGYALADAVGAEMHGPLGKEIVMSDADHTRPLIVKCVRKVFDDLTRLWNDVKQYYDKEFS